ncbi:MAG: HAD-IA family hydrolase [Candidatus Bathyarchaeota archaeon]|nr:MAG: HAD-IA family hydrolase [Candidatus Bathyarchaeota archaeon]
MRKKIPGLGLEIAQSLQRNVSLDELFNENNVNEASKERFLESFLQSFYENALTRTRLFPNVKKTLDKLSRKFKLALITRRHAPKDLVKKELERLQLHQYFASIVTALEVVRPAPFPDTILKAAKDLEVSTTNCVVISDSAVDIEAGKSVGAKTIAVLSGLFQRKELLKAEPDLIIKDINHIIEYVPLWNNGSIL